MNAILVVGKPAGSEVILGVSGCFGRIFSSWLANQPPRRRSNDLRNLLGIRRLSFFVGGGGLRQPECRARTLHGLCGKIKLTLRYGRYPRDRPWCCPLLEAWDVHARQEFTPASRRRLAFTVGTNGTDAQAAELATEWGVAVDDSILHALARKTGVRAEEQTLRRLETPAPPNANAPPAPERQTHRELAG